MPLLLDALEIAFTPTAAPDRVLRTEGWPLLMMLLTLLLHLRAPDVEVDPVVQGKQPP